MCRLVQLSVQVEALGRQPPSPLHPLTRTPHAPPPPAPPLQNKCHPQTIAVCQTRADGLGLVAEVVDESKLEYGKDVCGVLVQYPATDGSVHDYRALVDKAHAAGVKVCALRARVVWRGGRALIEARGNGELARLCFLGAEAA